MKRKGLKVHTIFRYEDETRLFYVMAEDDYDIVMNWELIPKEYHKAKWSPSSNHSSAGRENNNVIVVWPKPEPVPAFNDWGEDAL